MTSTFRTRQGSIEVATTSKVAYQSLRTRREGLEPVPGLGDDAFYQPNAVDDGLFVRKGDVHVRIDAGTAAASKALGPKAAIRIP